MKKIITAHENINQWIDDHTEEIIQFLQELIMIPSVTPWFEPKPEDSREAEVQVLIKNKLLALGAEIKTWEPDAIQLAKYKGRPGYYADHCFKGRPNQAAVLKGSGGGHSLLLTGHIDVVPAAGGWTVPPFSGLRRDSMIYGRGTVDMKGGIAAMIMATVAVIKSGYNFKGDVIVGTVVDEEAGGMGTLDFVDKGYRADACILTEPTNLKLAPLCRGILWGKLIIPGRSGHIELPQGDWREGGAVDAIALARVFMNHFDRLNSDWRVRKTHPFMPIPCQIHFAQFNAGEYPTAFANHAELVFDAQYLPTEKDEMGLGGKVKKEIETFVHEIALTEPWLRENPPKIEWMIDADCGETSIDHPFVRTVLENMEASGLPRLVEGVCAHTDIGWFQTLGIPTVVIGPGNPRLAHQNDERVSEEDLIKLAKFIASILIKWVEIK